MTTLVRLRAMVVDKFGVDPSVVHEGIRFAEHLGGDDLDRIELMMDVEEAFGVRLTDEDMQEFDTVGDLRDLIDKALNSKAAPAAAE